MALPPLDAGTAAAPATQADADAAELALQAQGRGLDRPWPRSPYTVNLQALQARFGGPPMTHPGAPFHKLLVLGGSTVSVPNTTGHDEVAARAGAINILPYDNAAGPTQHIAAEPVRGRPCELLQHAEIGDVYWGVSHMNFQHRAQGSDLESIKQHMTHMRLYTVVDTGDGAKGVAVVDFPRSYAASRRRSEPDVGEPNGVINPPHYPSTLYRIVFPSSVSPGARRAYLDNIRTWTMLTNKLARFPADYNGGDRLGTHTLERVREYGRQVLTALHKQADGRPTPAAVEALKWLIAPANRLYCAEAAAHVVLNLGLNVPLNAAGLATLDPPDDAHATALQRVLQAGEQRFWSREYPDGYGHGPGASAGDPGGPMAGLADQPSRDSDHVRRIAMVAAPAWLQPLGTLAFRPWDAVDMVAQYLRRIVPREQLAADRFDERTADVAQAQVGLFRATRPVLMATMDGLDEPARADIGRLCDGIEAVLARPDEKRSLDVALREPLRMARQALRADREAGSVLFVPPNRIANPEPDDAVRFEELGQWVHVRFCQAADDAHAAV